MTDAHALYVEGLRKHRDKDYDGAIERLEAAVEADDTLLDAWEALGVLYDKVERLDEAITATERLRDLDPQLIMAHTNLSRFYMKKGWIEKAEDAQAKARTLGWKAELASGGGGSSDFAQSGDAAPGPPPTAFSGMPSMPDAGGAPPPPEAPSADKLAKRITQFEAILKANPGDHLGRFTLGKTYLKADRAEDAVRELLVVLEGKPEMSAVYVVLGEAYEALGRRARALSTYAKGIEIAQERGDLHPRNQMQEALARLTG